MSGPRFMIKILGKCMQTSECECKVKNKQDHVCYSYILANRITLIILTDLKLVEVSLL